MHLSTHPRGAWQHAFLPWHRAYVLDLERELQRVDPAVALPYWRFDRPAPKVFSKDFMGAPEGAPSPAGGTAALSLTNPLNAWSIEGKPGIDRHPAFADPRRLPATSSNGEVRSDKALLALAHDRNLDYAYIDLVTGPDQIQSDPGFRDILEGNPHSRAHVSLRWQDQRCSHRSRRPAVLPPALQR